MLFGLLFEKQAETTLRNPVIIGTMLMAVGVVMWYADKIGGESVAWELSG